MKIAIANNANAAYKNFISYEDSTSAETYGGEIFSAVGYFSVLLIGLAIFSSFSEDWGCFSLSSYIFAMIYLFFSFIF